MGSSHRLGAGLNIRRAHTPASGDADAANDCVDRVPVSHRVVEPLQHQGDGPFADDGIVIEGPQAVLRHYGANVAGKINRSDERLVQFAAAKGLAGDLQGAQAGRFFAGDSEAGAAEPELAGDAAGGDAGQGAHGAIGAEGRPGGVRQQRIILHHRPAEVKVGRIEIEPQSDEYAGQGPGMIDHFCLPQRFAGGLQHQRLLGKHLLNLARRNAEALG